MNEELQAQNEILVDEGQNMAQPSPEMMGELTPEQALADLGISTRLSEEFLMSQVPQEGMEGEELSAETAPKAQNEPTEKDGLIAEEKTPEAKMELKNEIRTIVQEEMANLRKDIEEALMEESNEKSEA